MADEHQTIAYHLKLLYPIHRFLLKPYENIWNSPKLFPKTNCDLSESAEVHKHKTKVHRILWSEGMLNLFGPKNNIHAQVIVIQYAHCISYTATHALLWIYRFMYFCMCRKLNYYYSSKFRLWHFLQFAQFYHVLLTFKINWLSDSPPILTFNFIL